MPTVTELCALDPALWVLHYTTLSEVRYRNVKGCDRHYTLTYRQINWTVAILPTLTLHSSVCTVIEIVHDTTLHSTKLLYTTLHCRAQGLCESRGGRPGLPVPSPYGFCGRKATLSEEDLGSELRSCVKVEVAVLGSTSLIVLTISVAVKKHWTNATLHYTIVFSFTTESLHYTVMFSFTTESLHYTIMFSFTTEWTVGQQRPGFKDAQLNWTLHRSV